MRAPFWAAIAAIALTVAPSVALAQGAGQGVDNKFQGPVNPQRPFNTGDVISWNGVAWIASAGPSSGAVPTSRVISTTSPLTIDGGSSADLSANRTLAIAPSVTNSYVLATVAGVVSWVNPSTVVTQTLQAAYDGGQSITLNSSSGISMSDSTTGGNSILGITKNPSGSSAGNGLVVTMGANATGDALQALMLTGASGYAFRARNNGGSTTWSVNAAGTFMSLGGTTVGAVGLKSAGSSTVEIRSGDDSAYGNVNLSVLQNPTGQLQVGTFSAQDFILYTNATTRLTLVSDGALSIASSSAAISAASGVKLRNNSGVLELSQNGGAYAAVATGTPTLQSVAVAGRTYDGTSGAVRLYNASTGSTNALTLNDESAAGVGIKYVSNTGESGGVCMEVWNGDTSARASTFALYSKATDGFETPSGQSLLNASLNLNSGSTVVWRDNVNVFLGSNDLRLRRTAAKTLTLDDASAGAVTFDHVGRISISGSISTVSAASAVALRNNAGVLEASQNGGAYSPLTTTGTQLWTRTGTQLTPTTAGDDVYVTTTSAVTSMRAYNTGSGYGISIYAAGSYSMSVASDIQSIGLMQSSQAFAINVGPYQDWSGLVDGVSGQSVFGREQFAKENSTSANTAGYWRILTRPSGGGASSEAIRATSEHAFQIAASTGSTLSAANTVSFRSNAGVAEVSQNGGAFSPITTTASQLWSRSSTVLSPTTANDSVSLTGGITSFKNVSTAGWGVPAIYGAAEITGQTGNATICTYTLGAADGDVEVSATVNVSARTSGSFTVQVQWVDKQNNSVQMDFPVMQAGGTSGTFLANGAIASTGDFTTPVMHIRCKASSQVSITVPASGTFVGVTYSASGSIKQIR